jgi:hypothetical protein
MRPMRTVEMPEPILTTRGDFGDGLAELVTSKLAPIARHAHEPVLAIRDESGRPVAPPLSSVDAAGVGVMVTLFGWLAAVGLFAFCCWGLHHGLDRRRYRTWDTEWARVEPDWHDRSR